MARSLVLGNGTILVCLDRAGRVADFYYPYVGHENHIGTGDTHHVGVWVDGSLSWVAEDEWEIYADYDDETLASNIEAINTETQVRLQFTDVVYNESNIFIRSVTVENQGDRERKIRLFFHQSFLIRETSHADTAYYAPEENGIIHYKGRRVFLVSADADGRSFDDYSVGLYNTEGRSGTWVDAEDGELSNNPIEHGSVDSTLGLTFHLERGERARADYRIIVGQTFDEVRSLQQDVREKGEKHMIRTTTDFWHAWVHKSQFTFHALSPEVVNLFKKSLLVIRTHCDNEGGILASGDSGDTSYIRDTYGYVWPRDGAFIALALDKAGFDEVSHRFYRFAADLITERGYVLHKYMPDKARGSSWHPWFQEGHEQLGIQEDETALLIYGLWQHYKHSHDLEFVEEVYNDFIKRALDFILVYRDQTTGLPAPTYGLWEEHRGISTFTAASVYGALIAGGDFASLLGKENEAKTYMAEAQKIREAILEYLYCDERRYFYKHFNITDDGEFEYDDTIDASSFYGAFKFNILGPHDERLTASFETLRETLTTPVGGVMRYEGDSYYKPEHQQTPNAWFITTLWATQYKILTAQTPEDVYAVRDDLDWVVEHALSSGILPEQIAPESGEPRSVVPLIWSHGEFVSTVIDYMYKLERLGVCDARRDIE